MRHLIWVLWILVLTLNTGHLFAQSGSQGEMPQQHPGLDGAIVHLFEWSWSDIAQECEQVLAPLGYAAVQVSPPTEHVVGDKWWTRYQPVSYQLESRGGSAEEFASMVSRCNQVDVEVLVDLVINHMSGEGQGIGIAGSEYGVYDYPAVPWVRDDFHHCDAPDGKISDFKNRYQVQNCTLLSLTDLDTSQPHVQARLAKLINDYQAIGVSAFRIDAAKHMAAEDTADILQQVEGTPYIFQEVIAQPDEPIRPEEYFANGAVTDFNYGLLLAKLFEENRIADYPKLLQSSSLLPQEQSLVFIDNHDNQRGHGGGGHVLSHKDAENYRLAVMLMLGSVQAQARVMSSYSFTDTDAGSPESGIYGEDALGCGVEWICEHRWRGIVEMVDFYHQTRALDVNNWQTVGDNAVSFQRGERGLLAFNNATSASLFELQTSLPDGDYCSLLDPDCNIPHQIRDGKISFELAGKSALVLLSEGQ